MHWNPATAACLGVTVAQAWQRMAQAVFVEQDPDACNEVSAVWQSRQPIPACEPREIWKQASWPGKRAPLNRVEKWQLLQSVPNPPRMWSSAVPAVRA